MAISTKTDAGAASWRIDDDVIRLRVWGTDIIHRLPVPPVDDWTVGSDERCPVRITDREGLVSRQHCRLSYENARWAVRDLRSTNGTFIDGSLRGASVLEPGAELRIGKVTLLAESPRFIELRGFLARLLGWGADRVEVVDHALRAIRLAATRRAVLVLCGDGDLVPIALELHRRVLGEDKPFVLCDPRRRQADATVRSVTNVAQGMPALEAARGGTLCVWSKRRPSDFVDVTAALRDPSAHAQLIVCAHTAAEARSFISAPITIPSLTSRRNELGRVIEEYAHDAMASLAVQVSFTAEDRAWVQAHSAESLPEVEKGTRRLVALRYGGSTTRAAELLGMSPASLQEWIRRRPIPAKPGR